MEFYFNRGEAYFKKVELDKAVDDYTTAIQLRTDFYNAYFARAHKYAMSRQFNKSTADIRQGFKTRPKMILLK